MVSFAWYFALLCKLGRLDARNTESNIANRTAKTY